MTQIIKKIVFSEDKQQCIITFRTGLFGLFTSTKEVASIAIPHSFLPNTVTKDWYFLDTGEWVGSNLSRIINFYADRKVKPLFSLPKNHDN